MCSFIHEAKDEKSQQFHAFKLLNFILENVLRQEDCEISNLVKEIPGLLFVAVEVGNTEFLIKLIDYYHDLIWKVNDNNESIFHFAVSHRHKTIFNLLHEIGSTGRLIATYRDDDDNNMLHLAAKVARQHKLNKVSGSTL